MTRVSPSRIPGFLWLASTLFIVYGATVPFRFTTDRTFVREKLYHVALNPFIDPDTGRRVSIPDAAQNILLYVPFGLFGYLALAGRVRSPIRCVALVTTAAALLSATSEAMQLFTIDRTTSATDFTANTIGALGAAATARTVASVTRASRLTARIMEPAAFYPMMIATIVVCLAAWAPFDVTLEVGNLKTKLHAVRADPWQLANDGFEGIEFVRYVLFAVAVTSWLRQLGTRAPAALGAVASVAMAFGLEASQLAIESRQPGLADALAHSAGAVAGSALVAWAPRRRSAVFWLVLLVLATFVAGTAGIARGSSIRSFTATAPGALFPVRRVVELLLMYFPIGFALPMALPDGRAWYAAAVVGTLPMSVSMDGVAALLTPGAHPFGSFLPHLPLPPFLPVPPFVADAALATAGVLAGVWVGGPGWVLFRSRYWRRASKSAEMWSSPVPRDYRPGETKIRY
jgi:VanZ family protein